MTLLVDRVRSSALSLRALSVSSFVAATLPAEPESWRVHSCYRRTVNIIGGQGVWVSLHPLGVPLHAYSIIVDIGADAVPFLCATPGESVRISRSLIEIGDCGVAIVLEGADTWDAALGRTGYFSRGSAAAALRELRVLARACPGQSLFLARVLVTRAVALAPGQDTDLRSLLGARLDDTLNDIVAAWQAQSADRLAAALGPAIGLGFGLTPSGDDFVTGFVAAAHCFAGTDVLPGEGLIDDLVAAMRPLIRSTTLPSYFMLKAALEGFYPEPLRGLVGSLASRDPAKMRFCIDRLSDLGATSGRDMLAGVLFGFEVALGREECPALEEDDEARIH